LWEAPAGEIQKSKTSPVPQERRKGTLDHACTRGICIWREKNQRIVTNCKKVRRRKNKVTSATPDSMGKEKKAD